MGGQQRDNKGTQPACNLVRFLQVSARSSSRSQGHGNGLRMRFPPQNSHLAAVAQLDRASDF